MNFEQAYSTDAEAEVEGRWFPLKYGGRVKLARIGNQKYKEVGRKLEERARERAGAEILEDDEIDAIVCESLATAILLDWEIYGEGAKKIPYSVEKAKHYLIDLIDFRAEIIEKSSLMENFRKKSLEKEAKN
jgi:hypothetical protein